jgi:hypothetical protein
MAYLYKRSNWRWRLLIRYRMTAAMWRPLRNWSRLRHLHFRRRLAEESTAGFEFEAVASPGL